MNFNLVQWGIVGDPPPPLPAQPFSLLSPQVTSEILCTHKYKCLTVILLLILQLKKLKEVNDIKSLIAQKTIWTGGSSLYKRRRLSAVL